MSSKAAKAKPSRNGRYKTRLIKPRRPRRTKADIGRVCAALYEVAEETRPVTCRHIFYRMVAAGLIEKTESEYKNTVIRLLADMRKAGRLPYHWITDNTRWRMKPDTYSSLEEALEITLDAYRRALWNDQDAYVEVWTEKDAIASILYGVTSKWDVPLMTARGYSSLSFLYSVAEDLKQIGKPAYLYYFGDHDPSGVDSRRDAEEKIRSMAPEVEVHFETVAVNRYQIEIWNLPTRPTKSGDKRGGFKGESVEVDAISPDRLRALAEACIEQHVDQEVLQLTRAIEEAEQDTLAMILEQYAA